MIPYDQKAIELVINNKRKMLILMEIKKYTSKQLAGQRKNHYEIQRILQQNVKTTCQNVEFKVEHRRKFIAKILRNKDCWEINDLSLNNQK